MCKDLSYSDHLRSFAPFFIWRKTSLSQTLLGLAVAASHGWLSPPCPQGSAVIGLPRQAVTLPGPPLENTGIFNRKVVSSIREECDPTHLVRHQCTEKKQLFPSGKGCPRNYVEHGLFWWHTPHPFALLAQEKRTESPRWLRNTRDSKSKNWGGCCAGPKSQGRLPKAAGAGSAGAALRGAARGLQARLWSHHPPADARPRAVFRQTCCLLRVY